MPEGIWYNRYNHLDEKNDYNKNIVISTEFEKIMREKRKISRKSVDNRQYFCYAEKSGFLAAIFSFFEKSIPLIRNVFIVMLGGD